MAKFISEYRKLRIVQESSYSKEVNGKVITVPGETIEFEDGVYMTEDEEEIEFLENRPEFGRIIQRADKDVEKAKEEMNKTLEDKKEEEQKAEEEAKKEEMTQEGKGDVNYEFPDEPLSNWNKEPLLKKAKQLGLDIDYENINKKPLYNMVRQAKAKNEPQF